MRGNFDYDKMLVYASKDPDIADIKNLEAFVRDQVKEYPDLKQWEPSKKYSVEFQQDKIPGSSARPGFRTDLVNENFTNKPTEDGEYEEFNPDSISISVYKKMLRDPVIRLTMFILKGWISGLKFRIRSNDPRIEAVTKYVLKRIWKRLIRDMLDAVAFGFMFGEKVFQREQVQLTQNVDGGEEETVFNGKIVSLRKIKFLDPDQNFKFFKTKNDEISRIEQRQRSKVVSVDKSKIFWFALDGHFSGIFGSSRFKNSYEDWYHDRINKQMMLRHTERCGSPPLKIRHPEGTINDNGTIKGKDEVAVTMGKSYLNQGVVILPSEVDDKGNFMWDVGFDEVENSSNKAFIEVSEQLNANKVRGVGIPSGVVFGKSTFDAAESQSEIMLVVVEDIVDQIEETIQKELVDQLVEINFGPAYVGTTKIEIDKSALGRRKLFKDILVNTLRVAGSQFEYRPNMFPDLVGLGEELGIPFAPFLSVMSEKENAQGTPTSDSPMKEKQRDEDSNDELRDRPNPTDRDPREDGLKDDSNN